MIRTCVNVKYIIANAIHTYSQRRTGFISNHQKKKMLNFYLVLEYKG